MGPAPVFLADETNLIFPGCEKGFRPVRGAVVDDDEFELPAGLGEDGVHGFLHHGRSVVRRDDYRDKRL